MPAKNGRKRGVWGGGEKDEKCKNGAGGWGKQLLANVKCVSLYFKTGGNILGGRGVGV